MRLSLAFPILLISAADAAAEPMSRLFSTPHLETLTAEQPNAYRHVRSGGAGEADPGFDEVVTLERGADGAHVLVTLDAEGEPRRNAFRGMTGNPILMVFLESVVRAVSEATGGSPFYLRNRIKEAMRERMAEEAVTVELGGEAVEAYRIKLHPFAGDAHGDELGAFADLELSFLLADAVPGSFLALAASTGETPGERPAYSEEIRLDAAR